jgi:hypothetical protein
MDLIRKPCSPKISTRTAGLYRSGRRDSHRRFPSSVRLLSPAHPRCASAHYSVGKNGEIHQYVAESDTAFTRDESCNRPGRY